MQRGAYSAVGTATLIIPRRLLDATHSLGAAHSSSRLWTTSTTGAPHAIFSTQTSGVCAEWGGLVAPRLPVADCTVLHSEEAALGGSRATYCGVGRRASQRRQACPLSRASWQPTATCYRGKQYHSHGLDPSHWSLPQSGIYPAPQASRHSLTHLVSMLLRPKHALEPPCVQSAHTHAQPRTCTCACTCPCVCMYARAHARTHTALSMPHP
jgi:hypothetical protein